MTSPKNICVSKLPFTAEAVFVSLLEAGYKEDNINIVNKGAFKKSIGDDIEDIEINKTTDKETVDITLNRNSFYDLLPEGLFHQTKGSSKVSDVADAVEEHKQFKEEEKQARRFFSPLEQMLFLYSAATEQVERQAFFNIQNGMLGNTFNNFWNISADLPTQPANRMLRLMPYTNIIKGNIANTKDALAYVLQKKVKVIQDNIISDDKYSQHNLLDIDLGINSVLGCTANELFVNWLFEIKEVDVADLQLYASGNQMDNLLARFVEIFIPLDVDAEFCIAHLENTENESYQPILGVGSYLQ